ncbi:MAG: NADH-quinone oxidoreductase subunit N [Candidatus Promineifilaceae bacterium]
MTFEIPSIDYFLLLPLIWIVTWGLVLMFVDLIVPEGRKSLTGWLSLVGIVPALILTLLQWNQTGATVTPAGGSPMVIVDRYSVFLNAVLLLTGLLTVLISVNYLEKVNLNRGEYYMLMLFSLSGMMLMSIANDLILVFLALELLSIPLYILSGFAVPRLDSEESAMKYFLLGAFSSAFMVFGIALLYGATGSTALPDLLARMGQGGALGMAGAALLLVGFAFKVAAVPFHMWTPDVYEGAPTAVTAFMSVGAKVGGFAALIRVFVGALPALAATWAPAIAVLAALTMILGNVVALAQPNIKRMLAYSSIAHAGYILIGVAAGVSSPDGVSAALFYMLAYLFTNLGAFAVVIAVERQHNTGTLLDDFKGLARRAPLLSLAMAYFMLSLTGVPPTGGFSGKFYIFRAAIEADLVWLAVVGVVTSIISGYFYLRVVYLMFMHEGAGEISAKPVLNVAVALTVLGTLLLGLLPGPWFTAAQQAILRGVQTLAGG